MKYKIKGKVSDFMGNPLYNANVIILDKSFETVVETKTGINGDYEIDVECGEYMALAGLYEYGIKYLENWNWNLQVNSNLKIDMRIGSIEIYSINAFVPQGSPPPKIFVHFRPCSLKKYLKNEDDIKNKLVDYTCFGNNIENCTITVSIDNEVIKINQYDKIIENKNRESVVTYLLQIDKPSNYCSDKVYRLKIVIHDLETNEDGEGTLFVKFFS